MAKKKKFHTHSHPMLNEASISIKFTLISIHCTLNKSLHEAHNSEGAFLILTVRVES